jgi:regulator of protease activity HflC (stomatin/prohibitin superfamily)
MALEIIGFIMSFGFIFGIIFVIMLFGSIKLLMEFERAVVFRLGKYNRVVGPGLVIVIPILESVTKVDLRIKTSDIPRQEVITKDNIPLLANTVVYFKVERPADAIIKIEDYEYAVKQYTQAALRDVVGNAELDFVLTEREKIATNIKQIVDAETSGWGIDIESIKIQEIELPAEMKRAMAKQAEAERERRAVIIASDGELKASENLRKAAESLSKSPAAIQLRVLQTIRDIAADPSEKIVLFMPTDFGETLSRVIRR